jgi:hypothetical protein
MALIQINADMKRVAEALEEIRDLLRQAFNPQPIEDFEPSTMEDLYNVDDGTSYGQTDVERYGPRSNY